MSKSILLESTRELYKHRDASLSVKQIADATGIKPSWLNDFAWNRFAGPSVVKVEALYTFLSGKPLSLG